MARGKLIVFEGTDYSGKETQTKFLVKRLKKEEIPCFSISFPRYSKPTGRIIGECYLGKNGESWFKDPDKLDPQVASLYYAADRLEILSQINSNLNSGKHLILDRWVESNMAHQGGKAKSLEKRLKIINFIKDLEYGLLKLPEPDLEPISEGLLTSTQ